MSTSLIQEASMAPDSSSRGRTRRRARWTAEGHRRTSRARGSPARDVAPTEATGRRYGAVVDNDLESAKVAQVDCAEIEGRCHSEWSTIAVVDSRPRRASVQQRCNGTSANNGEQRSRPGSASRIRNRFLPGETPENVDLTGVVENSLNRLITRRSQVQILPPPPT